MYIGEPRLAEKNNERVRLLGSCSVWLLVKHTGRARFGRFQKKKDVQTGVIFFSPCPRVVQEWESCNKGMDTKQTQ